MRINIAQKRRLVEQIRRGGARIVYDSFGRKPWRIETTCVDTVGRTELSFPDWLRQESSFRAPAGLPYEFNNPSEAQEFLAPLKQIETVAQ